MTVESTSNWQSRWRLSYTRGDWLALAGPNAVVVLQPASPQWSELISSIWEDVLGAATIEDLTSRLAAFRLEQMPNFAAFFWGADGMRSVVRGSVRVLDDATGTVVADGAGVQTWSEHPLSGLPRVRVEMAPPDHELRLELPLVIGAASVSTLVLETSPQLQVRSPQGWEAHARSLDQDPSGHAGHPDDAAGDAARDAAGDQAVDPDDAEDRPHTLIETAPVAPASAAGATPPGPEASMAEEVPVRASADEALGFDDGPEDAFEPTDVLDRSDLEEPAPSVPAPPVAAPVVPAPVPPVPVPPAPVPPAPVPPAPVPPAPVPTAPAGFASAGDDDEDGHTLLATSLPGQPQVPARAPSPARTVVGVLRPSSGGEVEIDRPIVIGRSPSANRISSDQLPRLLTVPSPSHDISRTHVQVTPGDGQVLVTDLNSTNGTILIMNDGRQVTLEPSAPVPVDFGTVIDLGDGMTIRVERPR